MQPKADDKVGISRLRLYCVCAGDGNCFYRAFLVALLEDVALSPATAKCTALLEAFTKLYMRLNQWSGITDA